MFRIIKQNKVLIVFLILLLLTAAGIVLILITHKTYYNLMLFVGIGGSIGIGLNWLLIKVALDYIYIPLGFKKLKIPGSGIFPRNLDNMIDKISRIPAKEFLSLENIRGELKKQETVSKIKDLIFENLNKKETILLLTNGIVNILEKEETHTLVKETVENFIKESKMLKAAKLFHLLDCDKIAWLIADKLKMQIWEISQSVEKMEEFSKAINSLKGRIGEEEMSEFLINKIDSLLKTFDLEKAIKDKLQSYSYQDIKKTIEVSGKLYFDLLIIWGGISGVIVAIIIWFLNLFI